DMSGSSTTQLVTTEVLWNPYYLRCMYRAVLPLITIMTLAIYAGMPYLSQMSSLCYNVHQPAPVRILDAHLPTQVSRNNVIDHPYLSKECYLYRNLEARNVCCKTRQYTSKYVQICSIKMASTNKSRSLLNGHDAHQSIPRGLGNHWVFVGNSRVRKLMYMIVQIFDCPGTVINKTGLHQTVRVTHK
ncbi:unnamed protein product, partial [Meganyctiphanes norvegica]